MKKIYLAITVPVILATSLFFYFKDNATIPGAAEDSSVNMFTGKVSFSIPLATISSSSGPDFSLSLNYNSNVEAAAQIWNTEADAGDIGLGWQLSSHERIIRLTQNTGSLNDDNFMLVSDSSMKLLEYVKSNGSTDYYKIKNEYHNFTISHDTSTNPTSWTISMTDGSSKIFGGSIGKEPKPTNPKNDDALTKACVILNSNSDLSKNAASDCDTGPVENGVVWGNWVGPSYQAKNQNQIELAWHLSAIQDNWGNKTILSYVKHIQNVGTGQNALAFSKGAYLYKISQPDGNAIALNYCSKNKGGSSNEITIKDSQECSNDSSSFAEYVDPWTINQEPDGYQERLRVLYLGSVDKIYNYNNQQTKISRTALSYKFITTNSDAAMAKRILTEVQYQAISKETNEPENVVPSYQFSYFGQDTSDNVNVTASGVDASGNPEVIFNPSNGALYGAIKSITLPSGAVKTYSYSQNNLTDFTRQIKLPANLTERQILYGNDYAVVMGKEGSYIYSWTNFGWKIRDLKVPIAHNCNSNGCSGISLQKNFIAFLDLNGNGYVINKETKNNQWSTLISPDQAGFDAVVGNDFFSAFHQKGKQSSVIMTPEGEMINPPSNFIADHIDAGSDFLAGYELKTQNISVAIFNPQTKSWQNTIKTKLNIAANQQCQDGFSQSGPPGSGEWIYETACEVYDTFGHFNTTPNNITIYLTGKMHQKQRFLLWPFHSTHHKTKSIIGGKYMGVYFNQNRTSLTNIPLANPGFSGETVVDDSWYKPSQSSNSTNNAILIASNYQGLGDDVYSQCLWNIYDGYSWNNISSPTENSDNQSKLNDCTINSFSAADVNLAATSQGNSARNFYYFNPAKNQFFKNSISTGNIPTPQIKESKASEIINDVNQALGLILMIGGMVADPASAGFIATAFLVSESLSVAAQTIPEKITSADPISFSLNNRYINNGQVIWYKDSDGSLRTTKDTLVPSSLNETLYYPNFNMGSVYIPFSTKDKSGKIIKSYARILRNGYTGQLLKNFAPQGQITFGPDDKFSTSSVNMMATYANGKSIDSSKGDWYLYRIIKNDVSGSIPDYVVSSSAIQDLDGKTTKRNYSFSTSQAGFNSSGMYTSSKTSVDGYGYTQYYYLNGNNEGVQVNLQLRNNQGQIYEAQRNANDFSQLNGKLHIVEKYDNNNKLISQQINNYELLAYLKTNPYNAILTKSSNQTQIKLSGRNLCSGSQKSPSINFTNCSEKNSQISIGSDNASIYDSSTKQRYSYTIPEVNEEVVLLTNPSTQNIPNFRNLNNGQVILTFDNYCLSATSINNQLIATSNCYDDLAVKVQSTETVIDGIGSNEKNQTNLNLTSYFYNEKFQLSQENTTHKTFDPLTKKTNEMILGTEYIYAWQEISDFANKNLLDPLWRINKSRNPENKNETEVSANITTYKQWNNSSGQQIWAPEKTMRANSQNPGDFSDQSTPKNPQNWDIINTIISRDNRTGIPTKSKNIDGVISSSILSQGSIILPIASFNNVDLSTNQAGYYGAENYEKQPASLGDFTISNDDSYTGIASLSAKNNNATIKLITNYQTSPNSPMVISAWVKPTSNSQCFVGFGNNKTSSNINLSGKNWQYIEYTSSNPSASDLPIISCNKKGDLIDNIRFSPIASEFNAIIYDPIYRNITANIDNNGLATKIQYDQFNKIYASFFNESSDENDILSPFSINTFARFNGYSKDNNANDSMLVNSTISVALQDKNNGLYLETIDTQGTKLSQIKTGSSFMLRTQAILPESNAQIVFGQTSPSSNSITLSYDKATKKFTLTQGTLNINSNSLNEENLGNDWLFIAMQNMFLFFVDGKLILQTNQLTPLEENSTISSQNIIFSQLVFATSPLIKITYNNGFGQNFQSNQLSLDDSQKINRVITQEVIYDGFGLNKAITMKAAYENSTDLSFKENFVTDFNYDNGEISGDLVDYYKSGPGSKIAENNDYEYPYVTSNFSESPLHRINTQTIMSGQDFNINSDFAKEFLYQSNSGQNFMDAINIDDSDKNQFKTTSSLSTFAPKNIVAAEIISDQFGQTIASRVGNNLEYGWQQTAFSRQYDITNQNDYTANITTTLLPKYFDSKDSNANQFIQTSTIKDILARQTTRQTPNIVGAMYNFSDESGRLRFQRLAPDWSNKTSQGFKYIKYDILGRIIESGTLKNFSGQPQDYLAKANDPNFPSSSQSCVQEKYFYDIDSSGNSQNLRARLYKISSNNNIIIDQPTSNCFSGTDLGSNTILYQYDAFSKIIAISETNSMNQNSYRNTAYEYDNFNRIIKTIYPDKIQTAPFITNNQTIIYNQFNALGQINAICSEIDENNNCSGEIYVSNSIYDINSNLISRNLQNNQIKETFERDFQNRLLKKSYNKISDNSILFEEDLSYPINNFQGGNIANAKFSGLIYGDEDSEINFDYTYDTFTRLISAQKEIDDIDNLEDEDFDYSYDLNNNITQIKTDEFEKIFNYDPGTDKLNKTTTSAQNRSFGYNQAGAIITTISPSNKLINLTRQPKTQNIKLASINDQNISLNYNGNNKRISKTSNSSTANYYYGANSMPLVETIDGKNFINIYDYSQWGPTIRINQTDNTNLSLIKDHQNSTRATIDSNSNIIGFYDYDPYGTTTLNPNQKISNASEILSSIPYRYSGQYYDEDLELYYYYARFYDPTISRFLNQDPASQSISPYAAFSNNPIQFVDYNGMVPQSPVDTADEDFRRFTLDLMPYYYSMQSTTRLVRTHTFGNITIQGDPEPYKKPDSIMNLDYEAYLNKYKINAEGIPAPINKWLARKTYPDYTNPDRFDITMDFLQRERNFTILTNKIRNTQPTRNVRESDSEFIRRVYRKPLAQDEPYENLRNLEALKIANCGECANSMAAEISSKFPMLNVEVFQNLAADHMYVVVGRDNKTDPFKPGSWNREAVIVDAWLNKMDSARAHTSSSLYFKESMFAPGHLDQALTIYTVGPHSQPTENLGAKVAAAEDDI